MDKTIALFIAGIVLLVVAGTMGEDGAVSRLAERKGAATALPDPAPSPPARQAGRPATDPAPNEWFAADPQPSSPALPVYHYEKVEIQIPQEVVDPAVAAASEIK